MAEFDFVDSKTVFEDSYYERLNNDPEALGAIDRRNQGWEVFKSGSFLEGIELLQSSFEAFLNHPGGFERERYASTARLAQALCAAGEFSEAALRARSSVILTPPRVSSRWCDLDEELKVIVSSPDQYEIIFGGRLSLILAGSSVPGDLDVARTIAAEARALAKISENRAWVVFAADPDENKTPEEDEAWRRETRSKFGKVAWAATGAIRLPLGSNDNPAKFTRRGVAQRICAA